MQLLWNRGIIEKNEIKKFIKCDYGDIYDPFLFVDMGKSIDLIIKHIKKRNKITIFGDYDAGGVTSSALLFDVFRAFKIKADVYIPDRVKEGYGLNKKAIDYIESIDLPMCDRHELEQYLAILRHLSLKIAETQERIEEIADDDPYFFSF